MQVNQGTYIPWECVIILKSICYLFTLDLTNLNRYKYYLLFLHTFEHIYPPVGGFLSPFACLNCANFSSSSSVWKANLLGVALSATVFIGLLSSSSSDKASTSQHSLRKMPALMSWLIVHLLWSVTMFCRKDIPNIIPICLDQHRVILQKCCKFN